MRIGLFATCLGDTLFPEAVKSTAVLLARLGHEVVFPPEQTCCGQMHVITHRSLLVLRRCTLLGSDLGSSLDRRRSRAV
ncbi:heterodisulfide reductase-related iron-sulfur binding cluster, partial [Streptomyces sp. NPDC002346]